MLQRNTICLCLCGTACFRNMQMEKRKKTWDASHFRQQQMTSWPRSHPVMFPHIHTDHWTKMKTKQVPTYLVSVPATMVTEKEPHMYGMSPTGLESAGDHLLPPLTEDMAEASSNRPVTFKAQGMSYSLMGNNASLQDLPQYRNEYNDRARRGFCYWPIEKKAPKCHGLSFGAYKTLLGLPRV
ncbi:hypothetical protein DPEC_G00212510 [Dallia pectoralis]|uniref:Uncharacterized protein n=1 Tax=Dallia pectoralis TaxID=75939 RepID=A0ACC2G5Z5_DALPE|nr:hypothetical protein DPEC_G00212510 [Dallia pectoralis]